MFPKMKLRMFYQVKVDLFCSKYYIQIYKSKRMVYFKQTNNNSKPGPLPFREIAGASRWPRQSNFVYDWINLCCIFSDRKLIRRRTSSRNFSGKRKIVKNDRFRELFENFGRKISSQQNRKLLRNNLITSPLLRTKALRDSK